MNVKNTHKGVDVDARDELLQVSSLWDYFIEKTLNDAKSWFSGSTSRPPWGIFIVLVAAMVFFIFLRSWIAILPGCFSLGLFIWIVLISSGNKQKSLDSIISSINTGVFPVELKESITKRLRWWNSLIVADEWTKNSKIYKVRDKLNDRVQELDLEIKFWTSSEGMEKLNQIAHDEEKLRMRQEEQQRKLKLLKSRGVNVSGVLDEAAELEKGNGEVLYENVNDLVRLLKTKGNCVRQAERISRIDDPVVRAEQEKILVKALLLHAFSVIELIDGCNQYNVKVEVITSDNLNAKVKEIINTLEQRRVLVGKLNRIRSKKIMDLIDYDVRKAQSKISLERWINAGGK